MPPLAVFRATAEVDDNVNTALLKPREVHRGKAWRQWDVKATVAIKKRWVIAITLDPALGHNKHRDLGAILGLEENLLDIIIGWLEVFDYRRLEDSRLSRLQIEVQLRAWVVVRREAVIDMGVITITGCKPCAANSRQLDITNFAARLVELNHIGCDIFDVRNHKVFACSDNTLDVF